MTFLHYACQYGIEKIVTDLIFKGANINLKDSNGNLPLHFAAACTDNIQIIEAIINVIPKDERNICIIEYICTKNISGFNALRLAVEHKRGNIVEYLLKLYETYSLVIDNLPLLQLSSQKNDFSIFSLLEKSTCSTTYDKKGAVLIVAAENKNALLTEKLLLETDFSIEATDERGYTPLLIAASCDNIENVKVLIEHDASITAIAFNGKTILAVAVEHNATDVFKYLLSAEIMIFTLSETIAHFCQTKLLYQRNFHGRNTPLHIVAQTGNVEIFKAMIEYYHDVNIRNFDLQTPLHIAAENGNEEIFEALLKISTFSLHLPDKNNETPLSIACKNNSSKMIKFVMKDIDLISDPDKRKYYLQLSINTENTYLLKSLFNKHHLSQDIHHSNIHKDNQAYFKLFIENEYFEGVSFLLNSKNWKALLRRQPISERNPNPKSPMQLLVQFMPELAQKVFDKCIQGENYIYEFIDDIYYVDFLSLQLLARNQKDAAVEKGMCFFK
uniref:Uncharacterized protein n=1 Tax=Panagrolaimus davidi TaxID=227884 RepID=A0A914QQ42_9BILA